MKKNVGPIDRLTRAVVAIVLITIYLTGVAGNTLGMILLVVATVLMVTIIFAICPLYSIVGISTCEVQEKH